MTTPWKRLTIAIDAHESAKARVLVAEGLAHLGPDRARELEGARAVEQREAAALADAQADVDRLALEAEERAKIVPPDPGDVAVLDVLDKLRRKVLPAYWDKLRESGDPVDKRAVRHIAWMRAQERR